MKTNENKDGGVSPMVIKLLRLALEELEESGGGSTLDEGRIFGVVEEVNPDGWGAATGDGDVADVVVADPALPLGVLSGGAVGVEGVEERCPFHMVVRFVDEVRAGEYAGGDREWKEIFADLRQFELFKDWLGEGRVFMKFPKVKVTSPRNRVVCERIW